MRIRLKYQFGSNKPGSVVTVTPGVGDTLVKYRGAQEVKDFHDDGPSNKSMVGARATAVKKK